MKSFLLLSTLAQLASSFVIQRPTITTSYSYSFNTNKNNIIQVRSSSPTFLSATREEQDENAVNEVLGALKKTLKDGNPSDAKAAVEASDSLIDYLQDLESTFQQTNNDEVVEYDMDQLTEAVQTMDVDAIDAMKQSGLIMNEDLTSQAFWKVVNGVDEAEQQDLALSTNITRLLHHVFDADQIHLQSREQQRTNLTCMQPDESGGLDAAARKMNYVFDDGDHKNLPLAEGRKCEDGHCCEDCSRNVFPTFASNGEISLETFPELSSLTFNDLETVSAGTIIQFVRLVERVRRTISYEYGLPLSTILPLQAYSRKYVAGATQKGGGGGEGDFVTLHTDEATHSGYHYSCVLYLSSQGEDFEGGNFIFNDPDPIAMAAAKKAQEEESKNRKEYSEEVDADLLEKLARGELPDDDELLIPAAMEEDEVSQAALEDEIRRSGRIFTPFSPTRGAAVIFSSGWENMHEVEKITSGVRYAVPCFFTTCTVPEIAYDQMKVGKPKTDEDIADDWLHLLLAHRKEEPMESVGRVKELLMKWHYICTPLSMH